MSVAVFAMTAASVVTPLPAIADPPPFGCPRLPVGRLAERASKLKATTLAGYGVQAIAAIIQSDFGSAPDAFDVVIGPR